MAEDKKEVPIEELYKKYDDEQLQKILISLMTQNTNSDGDTGVQNPIAEDIVKELERRQGSEVTENKED